VDTEFYRVDQSRPERYKAKATPMTDEDRAEWRADLAKGYSIEAAARILFAGVRENKLYIGPQAFLKQLPELVDWVRNRAENILNEKNPIISSP
jgi:hypothetical protein